MICSSRLRVTCESRVSGSNDGNAAADSGVGPEERMAGSDILGLGVNRVLGWCMVSLNLMSLCTG